MPKLNLPLRKSIREEKNSRNGRRLVQKLVNFEKVVNYFFARIQKSTIDTLDFELCGEGSANCQNDSLAASCMGIDELRQSALHRMGLFCTVRPICLQLPAISVSGAR